MNKQKTTSVTVIGDIAAGTLYLTQVKTKSNEVRYIATESWGISAGKNGECLEVKTSSLLTKTEILSDSNNFEDGDYKLIREFRDYETPARLTKSSAKQKEIDEESIKELSK